jgi:hypothetical protein
MPPGSVIRYYNPFRGIIPNSRADYPRVTHPFAAVLVQPKPDFLARLACIKHAASVRSEPGSNSPSNISICFVFDPFTDTNRGLCHSELTFGRASKYEYFGPATRAHIRAASSTWLFSCQRTIYFRKKSLRDIAVRQTHILIIRPCYVKSFFFKSESFSAGASLLREVSNSTSHTTLGRQRKRSPPLKYRQGMIYL